jgi:hypothetical protein
VRIAVAVKADEEPEEKVKALTEAELAGLLAEVADDYRLLVEVLGGSGGRRLATMALHGLRRRAERDREARHVAQPGSGA